MARVCVCERGGGIICCFAWTALQVGYRAPICRSAPGRSEIERVREKERDGEGREASAMLMVPCNLNNSKC